MLNMRTLPAWFIPAMVSSVFAWGAQAEQRSFDVSPGGRFVLDADWGQVEVRTLEEAVIEVAVERAEKLSLEFHQDEGAVSVRSRARDKGLFGWFKDNRGPAPVFRVTVPTMTDLDLTTVGGNVQVDELKGSVAASTVGGKIVLGEIGGDVESRTTGGLIEVAAASGHVQAHMTGGAIRIGSAAGGVEAKTTGGFIRIEESGGPVVVRVTGGSMELGRVHGSIDARTTGGSIDAALIGQPDADSDLRTTGGSIRLAIADGISLALDARATGGRVSVDIPVTNQEAEGKSKLAATVSGGGPDLTLRTTGGSIHVRGM